ncbi:MAG: hypothetical protein ACXW2T_06385 [Allosphingosinicella sp.]
MRWASALAMALTPALGACSLLANDLIHDEKLVGPYRLTAIDTMETLSILWEIPGGGLVGDGLPGPTVFAAGYDQYYLAAAVHPQYCPPFAENCSGHGMNRELAEYYYVVRSADERERIPYDGIKGPFTASQFEAAKIRLGLPDFSRRFPELE